MGKKRNFSFYQSDYRNIPHTPTIFQKVGEDVVLSTDYPSSNLSPEDFELENLLASGVNVKSDVKFEEPSGIDKVDVVMSAVVDSLAKDDSNSKNVNDNEKEN